MRKYLRFFLVLMLSLSASQSVSAQSADTLWMVNLKEVEVKDMRTWTNDTARYRFNQLRFYVQTVWPYVTAATGVFSEVDSKLQQQGISGRDRKNFIHSKESLLRAEFEDRVKALNKTQGVLLIKLIARQTGVNIFSILQEFKNPVTAIKWQAWAKINGLNLNKKYDPVDEPLLEQVLASLGYDLPPNYSAKAKKADQNPF